MQTSDHAPQGEVATGITEDQAASELLSRWVKKGDESSASTEGEKPEETEETEAIEATTETEEPTEQEPEESGDIEIDIAGEKFKLPKALEEHAKRMEAKAKEVEAGSTKRFQEAADLRKAAEARSEQVERMTKIAQAQADLLADHKFIVRRLAQYEQINIQELAQTDPARLTAINAEYNQLTAAQKRIESAYQKAVSDMDAETTKARETSLQSLHEFASKNLKGWGKEADERLGQYLGEKGIDRESMLAVLTKDPKFLLVLEEAAYGHKVRTAAPQKAQPKTPTTLKPGSAGGAKTSAQQTADTAKRRLSQTGNVDDAAAALLARMNARKR